jgi:hypothetical protein
MVDLQEGDVGLGIGTDDLGGDGLAVIHDDFDLYGILHDVVVGDDVAVRGDQEAGSLALEHGLRSSRTTEWRTVAARHIPEEPLEGAAFERVGAIARAEIGRLHGAHFDRNDSVTHARDEVGEARHGHGRRSGSQVAGRR